MICWFCHWGWHPKVQEIYDEAVRQIGEHAMHFGPAHIVWEDENFNSAQWCLDNFEDHKGDFAEEDLAIVRWSLEQLRDLPDEFKVEPVNYDGKHPEKFPPAWIC